MYPNKVFDCISAARPVILAIDGTARELLARAQSEVYVALENAGEFAQAVLSFKQDPGFRQQCGQRGLSFVRQHFARDVLAEKYLDVLMNKVMKNGRGRAICTWTSAERTL